jgi:hypothetical protein
VSRGLRAAVVVLGAGLALSACGASSHATGTTTSPTSAPTTSAPAKPAPTDCTSASSVGAHAAAYVVQLTLGVDYREDEALPSIVQSLMTPAYFSSFSSYLASVQPELVSQKVTAAVNQSAPTYASGTCTAPVYNVAVVRTTSNTSTGSQTQNLTVVASMVWNGSSYLLTDLETSGGG